MVVGHFAVIHAAAVQGCAVQPGGIPGKAGVLPQQGDTFRHFIENVLRNIAASGSRVGHHFLFIQALRYGKRLVSREVQLRVRFLLQRGKVVQKRRFLAGFFPLNGFNHKLPGILYPLQGGYGFGLLFPLGGRLGGKIYSPAGGRRFELPKLGGYEIPVLQIAAAYHHERGCLHPAQREHPLPGGYAQRLGGVYPYQPVRFAAGLGREVEVIVTLSRLQVIQPLTDCLVGKAAYPQAHKWFPAVQVMEDIAED